MYRSRKEAVDSIRQRTRKVDGVEYTTYEAYLGTDAVSGVPKRLYDTDRRRLVQRVSDFYSDLRASGGVTQILTPQQTMDAKAALDLMAREHVEVTLYEAVRMYIAGEARAVKEDEKPSVPMQQAYTEYLKTFSEIQDRQIMSVKTRVGPLVAAMPNRLVSEVTESQIVEFLDSHKWSKKTWNNAMTYSKSFFAWCALPVRAYCKENPLTHVKRKAIAWEEPKYMPVADVERLVRIIESVADAKPEYLAFFVLSFFCGMRTAEIERMAEDETAVVVTIEDETIRVAKPKGYQKGIRPRAFHIGQNALEWMKSFDFAGGVRAISPKTRRDIGFTARRAGIDVPDNAGRHSFITYHVAAYGDPSRTEGMVGTSSTMRCRNYMGLASQKDGLAYFAIQPRPRS